MKPATLDRLFFWSLLLVTIAAIVCFTAPYLTASSLRSEGIAEITGPTTGQTGEPLKYESTGTSPTWTVLQLSDLSSIPPTPYSNGRWVIVVAPTPGDYLILAATYDDSTTTQAFKKFTITGDTTPGVVVPPLHALLKKSITPLIPPDTAPILLALAKTYKDNATALTSGTLPVTDLPSSQKTKVSSVLGDRKQEFIPLLSKLGEILNVAEIEAGWSTPSDYARVWKIIADVLQELGSN